MSSDEGKSPLDIINEARRGVASADEEPAGSSSHDARAGSGYPGIARTREEHIKRATGSFSAVGDEQQRPRTNNPRELKAAKEKERAEALAREAAVRRDAAAASVAAASDADARPAAPATPAPAPEARRLRRKKKDEGVADAPAATTAPADSPASPVSKRADASGAGAAPGDRTTAPTRPRRRPARAKADRRNVPPATDRAPSDSDADAPDNARGASRHTGLIARIITVALAVVLLASVGGFSWYRWFSGDDAADFQGAWYIAGTDTPIEITEDRIVLNDEVAYGYALDESAKTIEFSFSYLEGAGHYRFSLDRQMVAIMDGRYGWWDTLGEDLAWLPGALVESAGGTIASPAGKGGVTLLSRQPASALAETAEGASSGDIADAAAAGADGTDAAADAAGASDSAGAAPAAG